MKGNTSELDLLWSQDADREDLPLLTVAGKLENLLASPAREALEKALPRFLLSQRWFGGKARPIKAVRIADWTVLQPKTPPVILALLQVEFQDGTTDLYSLPLGVVMVPTAAPLVRSLRGRVLARLSGQAAAGLLVDALADEDACEALLAAIANRRELATRSGLIRAMPTPAYAALRGPADVPLYTSRGFATSSNSLVSFGERLLLKMFRRLDAGINPDLEISRFLTEKTEFRATPRIAGYIEYQRAGIEPATLAIFQELVTNDGDGWHHALKELTPYFERVSLLGQKPRELAPDADGCLDSAASDPPQAVQAAIGGCLSEARTLGKRTAEMHLALAQGKEPAFAPKPLTAADLIALAGRAYQEAQGALALLQENVENLVEPLRGPAQRLIEQSPSLLKGLREFAAAPCAAAKIRCHGDYHLGQVLRVEKDFVIIDFEGEPARPIDDRRAKQCALKDVAGMLRSFSYAAHAGLFDYARGCPEDSEKLSPWAEFWARWMTAVFLKEYRTTAGAAPFIPADPKQFAALLRFFMLDKAFYELIYELNNRPDWVGIPLEGINDCGLRIMRQDGSDNPQFKDTVL